MAKLPTVEDVARVAGVSRQTVSNVINAPEIVREVTRERVQAAITQLGYAPSMAARRLRTQRSATTRREPSNRAVFGSFPRSASPPDRTDAKRQRRHSHAPRLGARTVPAANPAKSALAIAQPIGKLPADRHVDDPRLAPGERLGHGIGDDVGFT